MTAPAFAPFDPLEVRSQSDTSLAAQRALRREIQNILSSYVGWYDPFCELVQNALDAVDKRAKAEEHARNSDGYRGTVRVIIDLDANSLSVSDNGVGMDEQEFRKFLAPNFSFKEERTDRGHKGVGATYLAYGFNYLRVHTRQPGHEACGRIVGARDWTESLLGTDAPRVEPDTSPDPDETFSDWTSGTSVTVKFDAATQPSQLSWLKAGVAKTWLNILRVRTGIGSVVTDTTKTIEVICINNGHISTESTPTASYFWLHERGQKGAVLRDLQSSMRKAFEKTGDPRRVPNKFKDLIFVQDSWSHSELSQLMYEDEAKLHQDVIDRHSPSVQFEFGYTSKLWTTHNDALGVRANMNIVKPGIQLAANKMPQGDVIQVPLTRYIGRQNQVHFLVHFENYTPDLGRKGFSKPLVDFASDLARAIVQLQIPKIRDYMKRDSGAVPDLGREMKLEAWKEEMLEHERRSPLALASEHFFHPTRKISITSLPTREQDVIALFHEMISGGVVRGVKIMATNERLTYDGLFRISFTDSEEIYVYDEGRNPLGVEEDVLEAMLGQETNPRVLEYKYSLDGLMADLDAQEKNINDVDLCVAWELGEKWKERYAVTTLLVPENVHLRQFHGATHILVDPDSGARQADLIILSDLVELLTSPVDAYHKQRELFE